LSGADSEKNAAAGSPAGGGKSSEVGKKSDTEKKDGGAELRADGEMDETQKEAPAGGGDEEQEAARAGEEGAGDEDREGQDDVKGDVEEAGAGHDAKDGDAADDEDAEEGKKGDAADDDDTGEDDLKKPGVDKDEEEDADDDVAPDDEDLAPGGEGKGSDNATGGGQLAKPGKTYHYNGKMADSENSAGLGKDSAAGMAAYGPDDEDYDDDGDSNAYDVAWKRGREPIDDDDDDDDDVTRDSERVEAAEKELPVKDAGGSVAFRSMVLSLSQFACASAATCLP